MDAFFAAVEVLDNPSLKGKPVIVGGTSGRGVVSTATYEARRFGIHSAMPIFKAKEKCPHGIFLSVRKHRYQEVSKKVMDLLRDFTPLVEQVSIDEAYLDITGSETLLGSAEEIARRIKARIAKEGGLTCSIGIAPNKFLAKIASDMHKPDGLTIISRAEVDTFLSRLPLERISGIGKRTLEVLWHYGVKTVGDLKGFNEEQLVRDFGKFGHRLYELARGIDDSRVVPHRDTKSVSSEETLESDTQDLACLRNRVASHASKVAWRVRRERLKGRTITLKIKLDDFSEVSKSLTIGHPTDSTKTIWDSAVKLLLGYPLRRKVRLIGVVVSNLEATKEEPEALPFMLGDRKEKERKTDEAMDEIKSKFGREVIRRGEN
jgi:DNA polymerase-4